MRITATRTRPARTVTSPTRMRTIMHGCAIAIRITPICTTDTVISRGTLAAFLRETASGRPQDPGHQRQPAQGIVQHRGVESLRRAHAARLDDDARAHRRYPAFQPGR